MDPNENNSNKNKKKYNKSPASTNRERARPNRIVVEPTSQQQLLYNRIRGEVDRQSSQSHASSSSGGLLRPPSRTRLSTNDGRLSQSPRSTTMSAYDMGMETELVDAAAGGEPVKRPRGRRTKPLNAETRLNTAVKRVLKFVCHECKTRKITCRCYDLSKLEEAYLNTHRAASNTPSSSRENRQLPALTLNTNTNPIHIPGPTPPTNEFLGLDSRPTAIATSLSWEDDLDDITMNGPSEAPNARTDVWDIVNRFDVARVTGVFPTSAYQYSPGLGTTGASLQIYSTPIPIGSEFPGQPGWWKCEFAHQNASEPIVSLDDCTFTGSFHELNVHFRTDHHPFRDPVYWCECVACLSMVMSEDRPAECIKPNCSPYGVFWKRWYYGHMLVESAAPSTPALTQSGESEYSFNDRGGSQYQLSPGGRDSNFDGWSGTGGGHGGSCYYRGNGSDYGCDADQHSSPRSDVQDQQGFTLDCSEKTPCHARSNLNALRSRLCPYSCRYAGLQLRILCMLAVSLLSLFFVESGCAFRIGETSIRYMATVSHASQLPVIFILCGFAAMWFFRRWQGARNLQHLEHADSHPSHGRYLYSPFFDDGTVVRSQFVDFGDSFGPSGEITADPFSE